MVVALKKAVVLTRLFVLLDVFVQKVVLIGIKLIEEMQPASSPLELDAGVTEE